ncbi:MAG: hypothetical protein ACI9JL_002840 [Paracoccaceae bacterium]
MRGVLQTPTIRGVLVNNSVPEGVNTSAPKTSETGRQMANPATGREVIVEFQQIGNAVKVTAIDTKSMVEVSIMGPASAGEELLKRNAINKLNYVLSKKD